MAQAHRHSKTPRNAATQPSQGLDHYLHTVLLCFRPGDAATQEDQAPATLFQR